MQTLSQAHKTGPSVRVLSIVVVLEYSSPDAPATTRVVLISSTGGPLSAVVLVTVYLLAGTLSDTGDTVVGRSATYLVPASFVFSRPCAVLLLSGSLPGDATDPVAFDTATLSCQFTIAGRHGDDHPPGACIF